MPLLVSYVQLSMPQIHFPPSTGGGLGSGWCCIVQHCLPWDHGLLEGGVPCPQHHHLVASNSVLLVQLLPEQLHQLDWGLMLWIGGIR
eukprot:13390441-Ditylum_brightwellii.AAC.1